MIGQSRAAACLGVLTGLQVGLSGLLGDWLTDSPVISVVLQKQEKITPQWTNNVGTEPPQGEIILCYTEVTELSHIFFDFVSHR